MSYIETLENAIHKNEIVQKKNKKKSLQLSLIELLENFIQEKKLVCYGGIAINNILPDNKKFYDEDLDIPDYDFFSPNAYEDAIELAKLFSNKGYENIEAKTAVIFGTYKVFVNFIPIADITQIETGVFNSIQKASIKRNHILYCPPTYLRMSLYQELSRPLGDISRWDKVYKRLTLLNENIPLNYKDNCDLRGNIISNTDLNNTIYKKLKKIIVDNQCVLFGDYGLSFYKSFFPKKYQTQIQNKKINQLFVLSESFNTIKELLKSFPYEINYIHHNIENKFMNDVYEVNINNESFLYIFLTNSCQSYNQVYKNKKVFNIATIDTILSIFYALQFVTIDSIDKKNLLSYCYLLENIHSNNKTNVLRRFYLPCVGKQMTIEDIKKDRNTKYKQLKNSKNSIIFKKLFLKYQPKKKTLKKNKLL